MNRRNLLICFLLAAGTFAVYWPVHRFGFVNFDDYDYVTTNPHVSGGLNWDNFRWAFTTFYCTNYHPLTWISLQLDVTIWGVNPHFMHIENVLFHAINSMLLFFVMLKATGRFGFAAFIAALFAVHPTHVESVAWITERKDTLSTFFLFSSLLCYLVYLRSKPAMYMLVLVLYGCGLLAKSMLVTFPFLLLLLDYWPLHRIDSTNYLRRIVEKIPMMIMAFFSSVMTYRSQQSIVAPLHAIAPIVRLGNIVLAYTGYLSKEFWPVNLSILYPYLFHVSPASVWGALIFLLCLTAFFVSCFRTMPWLTVGWLWFIGTMVPVIGIVQVGAQSMADRYLYLPSIGLSIMVAWTAQELLRPRILTAISLLILSTLAVLSRHQVAYWQDGYALWGHASVVLNGNATAQVRLGYEAAHQGDTLAAQQHYQAALKFDPLNYPAELNLGNLLLKDHPDLAAEHFCRAAQNDPTAADAQTNWGVALLHLKNPAAAFEHFQRAESLAPNAYDPHYNLGQLLLVAGKLTAAQAEFSLALQARPGDVKALEGLQQARQRE